MTEISPQQAAQIAEDFYGLRGEITPLDSEWGGTFRLKSETGNYLIKIAPNHVDQGRTAMEVAALKHLGTKDCQHS